MNEETQRSVFHYLKNKKIENFLGVPDSTLKYFIDECQKNNNIIICTAETRFAMRNLPDIINKVRL